MPFQQLQSSLIEALDASPPFTLPSPLSLQATALLNTLTQHYGLERKSRHGYKPATLIQVTFKHVMSKDAFLLFFFSYVYQVLLTEAEVCFDPDTMVILVSYFEDCGSWDSQRKNDLKSAVEDFAENFVANFLLPRTSIDLVILKIYFILIPSLVKATSGKTPQPTSDSLTSTQLFSSPDTPQSISILRQRCLERDRYRCVVSRKFDKKEAKKRLDQQGEDCEDDDGVPLKSESQDGFEYLEVGHILSHRLVAVGVGETDIVCAIRTVTHYSSLT